MKHIDFYLDFVSPYAHLAFERLPGVLEGISYSAAYKPVLLGAVIKHHGQKAPAELPPKRAWTYRQVSWLGHSTGVGLEMPARHPFSPLPILRQALACSRDGYINRFVAETVLRHVWRGGHDALDPQRLEVLAQTLAPQTAPGGDTPDHAKVLLRENTDAAIALGVFGVPTFVVDGKLFWGFDGLPMLRDYLAGDAWFGDAWDRAAAVPSSLAAPR